MRILVTGAAGVLGGATVAALHRAGHEAIAVGRVPAPGIELAWDLAGEQAPPVSLQPDVVVHAAARIGRYGHSLADASELWEINVTGTLRLLQWCERAGVKKLVLCSGAIVYGDFSDGPRTEQHPTPAWLAGAYALSKLAAEQLTRQARNLDAVILRLSSLYGAGYSGGLPQRFLRKAREDGRLSLSPPFDTAFDLLHVGDAAATLARGVEHGGSGTWNVGGGRLTTIEQLARACAERTGAALELTEENSDARPGTVLNWVDDSRARAELGHRNEWSLTSALAEIDGQLK